MSSIMAIGGIMIIGMILQYAVKEDSRILMCVTIIECLLMILIAFVNVLKVLKVF